MLRNIAADEREARAGQRSAVQSLRIVLIVLIGILYKAYPVLS